MNRHLRWFLRQFAAECEATRMRISTCKSEAMVLGPRRELCPLQAGVQEFKYVEVERRSTGGLEQHLQ